MADLLIRDVTLPTAERTTLGIRDAHFVDPGDLTHPEVIEADGLIALPGLVDLHTHLREPAPNPAETIESGTAAAARGGYTAVFAMANTDPVTDTAQRVRDLRMRAFRAHTEVIPVGAVTMGLQGRELSEIEAMSAQGVTVYSDDGHCVMDARLMREALLAVGRLDGVIAQHSQDHHLAGSTACLPDTHPTSIPTESTRRRTSSTTSSPASSMPTSIPTDPTIWPRVAEAVIIARDVQLAADTGARVHICHISTAEGVEVLRWAKARHIPVTAEATPHHLLLDLDLLDSRDTTFKVNPPLRQAEDRAALREALADGTIDIVGTDHAPHLPADKSLPFPQAKPGMIGLEWALGIVMDTMVSCGLMDWSDLADRMSHAPARIGRISDRQGRPIAIGEPANLTLIDPHRRKVVDRNDAVSMGRNNPYHGLDLPDPVMAVFWRGVPTWASPALR